MYYDVLSVRLSTCFEVMRNSLHYKKSIHIMAESLYKISAKIISNVLEGKGGVKSLVYNRSNANPKQNKSIFALVSETLKYEPIISEIIKNTEIEKELNKKKRNNKKNQIIDSRSIVLILIYELFFSQRKRINSGKSFWKSLIMSNKNSINSNLVRLKIKKNAINNSDLLPESASYVLFILWFFSFISLHICLYILVQIYNNNHST